MFGLSAPYPRREVTAFGDQESRLWAEYALPALAGPEEYAARLRAAAARRRQGSGDRRRLWARCSAALKRAMIVLAGSKPRAPAAAS